MADLAMWLNQRWLNAPPEEVLVAWARAGRVPVPWEAAPAREGDLLFFTTWDVRWWAGFAVVRADAMPSKADETLGIKRGDWYTALRADVLLFPDEKQKPGGAYGLPQTNERISALYEGHALSLLEGPALDLLASRDQAGTLYGTLRLRALRGVRDIVQGHYEALPAFRRLWWTLTDRPTDGGDNDDMVLPATPAEASLHEIQWFYREVFLLPHAHLRRIAAGLERLDSDGEAVRLEATRPEDDAIDVQRVIAAENGSAARWLGALDRLTAQYGEG